MSQFNKVKLETGGWRFECDGVSLIIDGFIERNGQYRICNSEKAIALFDFEGELYSVSNQLMNHKTVEDLYHAMKEQYAFFMPRENKLKYAS